MKFFMPIVEFLSAMQFSEDEGARAEDLLGHVFWGLAAENLIEDNWSYGELGHANNQFPKVRGVGIVCQPSVIGTDLFLWAFGAGNRPRHFLFDDAFAPVVNGMPVGVPEAIGRQG